MQRQRQENEENQKKIHEANKKLKGENEQLRMRYDARLKEMADKRRLEQQKCDQRMEKNKQDLEMKRQREKTCMNKKLEQQKKC